jgi:hypothetical protein
MSVETTNSLHNAYGLHSSFKLKTCLTKPRTSHLDACTSMEHAQIIRQMSLTHLSEVGAKFHARIVHQMQSHFLTGQSQESYFSSPKYMGTMSHN